MSLTATEIRNTPITDEQAAPIGMTAPEMEEKFIAHIKESGVTRRVMFAVLAMDARKLAQSLKNEEEAEAFLNVAECANVEIEWLEAHLSLMSTARARVFYALSHFVDDEEGEQ